MPAAPLATALDGYEVWFVTGSQQLYGDETLRQVAEQSEQVVLALADLPVRSRAQFPGINGKVHYSEGLLVGYRWFDQRGIKPLFPFGHGLSYTKFRYSGLRVTPRRDGATVRFTLRNVGRRAGAEVAQVYVGAPARAGELAPAPAPNNAAKVRMPPCDGTPSSTSKPRSCSPNSAAVAWRRARRSLSGAKSSRP